MIVSAHSYALSAETIRSRCFGARSHLSARKVGIVRLIAESLEGNRPMLATFRHLGLSMTTAASHRGAVTMLL